MVTSAVGDRRGQWRPRARPLGDRGGRWGTVGAAGGPWGPLGDRGGPWGTVGAASTGTMQLRPQPEAWRLGGWRGAAGRDAAVGPS